MKKEFYCPHCGSGATTKRSVQYKKGTSTFSGKRSGGGGSIGLTGSNPRVWISGGTSTGTRQSQFSKEIAPLDLSLIYGIVLLVFLYDLFSTGTAGWMYVVYGVGALAFLVQLGDLHSFETEWVCNKCGQKFVPAGTDSKLGFSPAKKTAELVSKKSDAEGVPQKSSSYSSPRVYRGVTISNDGPKPNQIETEQPQIEPEHQEDPVPMLPPDLDALLGALQHHQIRATYGAVGEFLGIPAISVGKRLGAKRPEAPWVVSKQSSQPTGYSESECHPALADNPHIIESAQELRELIRNTGYK